MHVNIFYLHVNVKVLIKFYRFLATGDAVSTIAISYCIGKTTAWSIVYEVCLAIWGILSSEYLPIPNREKWRQISDEYYHMCNFPNCIGAIDGKHIALQAPSKSGSEFYNYKHYHSIVFLAMCDARHCLTVIDIGASGRESDGGVFGRSTFGQMFSENELDIPISGPLPGCQEILPFVAVADAAFPLRRNLMKPFGGKNLTRDQMVFNYRLSRARITIENTFGLLATRWRMFRRSIAASPSRVEAFAKATFVLHNYLQRSEENIPSVQRLYCPPGYTDSVDAHGGVIPGQWRLETDNSLISSTIGHTSNRYGSAAATVRDKFVQYFVGTGRVSWQNSSTFGTK